MQKQTSQKIKPIQIAYLSFVAYLKRTVAPGPPLECQSPQHLSPWPENYHLILSTTLFNWPPYPLDHLILLTTLSSWPPQPLDHFILLTTLSKQMMLASHIVVFTLYCTQISWFPDLQITSCHGNNYCKGRIILIFCVLHGTTHFVSKIFAYCLITTKSTKS